VRGEGIRMWGSASGRAARRQYDSTAAARPPGVRGTRWRGQQPFRRGDDIARSLLPSKEKGNDLYALEVQGDSMIDAMVNDGDIVIMKTAQGKETRNGEMVAVWLDNNDETTLKYYYQEKNRIRLQPANPTMAPIYIDNPQQVRVLGKVVMVIRQIKAAA